MNLGHLYVVFTTLTRPPKDKLAICICPQKNLFLWINTKARPHGVGQVPLNGNEHPSLKHACHLDCSRITTFLPAELVSAVDRGPISKALAATVIAYLALNPPKTLTPAQIALISDNLNLV